MPQDVRARVEGLVKEALDLRFRASGDPEGPLGSPDFEDVTRMLNDLHRIRRRSDRLDAIMAAVTRLKYQAKRDRDNKAFEAEIAYDEAALDARAKRREDSFDSAGERKAQATLGSLNEKRAFHQANLLVEVTAEAFEIVTQIHWQFSAMRRETLAALRAAQLDQNLDH